MNTTLSRRWERAVRLRFAGLPYMLAIDWTPKGEKERN